MDLQTYCEKNGGTGKRDCPVLAKVAGDSGYSAETLYMVAKGHKTPGPLMAAALDRATGGGVQRAELRPDVFDAPADPEQEAD
jgi:hypothetical protein